MGILPFFSSKTNNKAEIWILVAINMSFTDSKTKAQKGDAPRRHQGIPWGADGLEPADPPRFYHPPPHLKKTLHLTDRTAQLQRDRFISVLLRHTIRRSNPDSLGDLAWAWALENKERSLEKVAPTSLTTFSSSTPPTQSVDSTGSSLCFTPS